MTKKGEKIKLEKKRTGDPGCLSSAAISTEQEKVMQGSKATFIISQHMPISLNGST